MIFLDLAPHLLARLADIRGRCFRLNSQPRIERPYAIDKWHDLNLAIRLTAPAQVQQLGLRLRKIRAEAQQRPQVVRANRTEKNSAAAVVASFVDT
jgi:hypothetical protein